MPRSEVDSSVGTCYFDHVVRVHKLLILAIISGLLEWDCCVDLRSLSLQLGSDPGEDFRRDQSGLKRTSIYAASMMM